MIEHILLPTDGSALSENSVKYGLRLAKKLGARVTALHVIPASPTAVPVDDRTAPDGDARTRAIRAHSRNYLDFARKAALGAGVECEVRQVAADYPFKAIIAVAQEGPCDLIVMASHGRRGLESLLLGSETQKVLTHSRIPILVCRE